MEFVLVRFPEPRAVRMEGLELGPTGQILPVERGTHVFDLAGKANYEPPNVETVVIGTSEVRPLVIEFQLMAVSARRGVLPPGGGFDESVSPEGVPSRSAPVAKKRVRKRTKKAPKRNVSRKRASRKTQARTKPARKTRARRPASKRRKQRR